ncbi:PhzF family phenazine biosynthesis protein [Corynebacterium sp.]|uniref:PhzF family phenazine biosynthesis protein n=1 Tax=Corynebacterium sp. TaxID=1720 RepID=UPI0026DD1886|nr:PhzF family phenazine biosynthesis protein [Corynebacterium sp.]MDO5032476.1 PhzF family phenazine biosynthesis protein [Corynebacterium sp.]
MQHRFFEVDVFSTGAFSGNPLAVVADAEHLSEAQMQRIARWTNFSETTFLSAPGAAGADYQVRIFSPAGELPFAGHPTLGSARVFAELSGGNLSARSRLVQHCPGGLITVRAQEGIFSFANPPLHRSAALRPAEFEQACDFLGLEPGQALDHAWVDNGPGWRLLHVPDAEVLRGLRPRFGSAAACKVGVVALTDPPAEDAYEVRAFTPAFEDPVTGSLQGGIAQFLRSRGLVPERYTAVQGLSLGRRGRVHIEDDSTDIWVGGRATIRVRGCLDSGEV